MDTEEEKSLSNYISLLMQNPRKWSPFEILEEIDMTSKSSIL